MSAVSDGQGTPSGPDPPAPRPRSLEEARVLAVQEVRALRKLAGEARAAEQRFLHESGVRSALWARLVRYTARRHACVERRAALPHADPSGPGLDRTIEALTREIGAMADALHRGGEPGDEGGEVAAALRDSRALARALTCSELFPGEVQRPDHLLAALEESSIDGSGRAELRGWIEEQTADLREVVNALGWEDLGRADRHLARIDRRLEWSAPGMAR